MIRKKSLQAAKKNVFRYQREIIVLGVSLFVFTVLLGFSSQLINRWATFSIDKQTAPISKGIEESLQYVSEQRQAIITSRVLDSALVVGDQSRLLILVQAEAEKRGLDFVVVTDRDGFVLARSHL